MAQRLHLDHTAVHTAALKTYLVHHCHDLWFGSSALGALRARDWTALLEIADAVDEALTVQHVPGLGSLTEVSSDLAVDVFSRSYQFVAMVTKYPFDSTQVPGLDPDAAAVKGFLAAERRSKRINSILRAYRTRGIVRHPAHELMRAWLVKVFGHKPDLPEIYRHCDFSGGASLGVHGKATHFGNKVVKGNTCTPAALTYFTHAVLGNEQLHAYYSHEAREQSSCDDAPSSRIACLLTEDELYEYFWREVKLVQHDKISCVPKKYNKSRLVGTPATYNTFVQKGTDIYMRRLLKERGGIDLARQDINQQMAFEGSLEDCPNPYVTEDVKDASNSVLIEVVRTLFTDEWFSFLNRTRSPGYTLPNGAGSGRFELFVSMGNGFCFPLETSIFASICVAACKLAGVPVDFRVYGDDIIVRQDVILLVREILRSLGFRTNTDKSYAFGPFRESCGANWYGGRDVTPVFWRKRITDRRELHAIHNAFHKFPKVQETLRGFDPSLPYCVPDTSDYHWVVDQAFRVSQDVCMSHGAVWRRDTQSFRYPMLITQPIADDSIPAEDRWLRLRHISALRGSTFEGAFLLRRASRCVSVKPDPYRLECETSKAVKRWKAAQHKEKQILRAVASGPRHTTAALRQDDPPPEKRQFPWIEAVLRSVLHEVQQEKLREELLIRRPM